MERRAAQQPGADFDRRSDRRGAYESALHLIGSTPLIGLRRLHDGPARIMAKAEFLQPGASVKDRAARAIIEGARSRGELKDGQPVVEMTSGNMGSALAVVCNVLGHPLVLVMSSGNSPARARMMEGLGAEVVLVSQVDGAPGRVTGSDIDVAQARAREIAKERGAFLANQFENTDAIRGHEQGTGPEIVAQASGAPDAFVASIGTGGTFLGVSRHLKSVNPATACIAVEPSGVAVLAGEPLEDPRHLLQGTGYGTVPPLWDPSLPDGYMTVSDEEATLFRRRLAHEEGLWVGYSSAANVCAASRLLASGSLDADAVVATVLCDSGLKY